MISIVGLYAVVASGVSERTREIGVRDGARLDAGRGDAVRDARRCATRAHWTRLGLGGAAIVARLMSALLYGLSPADPITFALVPLTLVSSCSWRRTFPARRAVKLDPVAALRSD